MKFTSPFSFKEYILNKMSLLSKNLCSFNKLIEGCIFSVDCFDDSVISFSSNKNGIMARITSFAYPFFCSRCEMEIPISAILASC